jgi:hypothetical protein
MKRNITMNEADNVTDAEAIVTRLNDKQRALNQRAVELADERGRIAFSVHGDNDPKARARLDKINAETSVLASEQASIEAALVEANARLDTARRSAALEADRQNALLLKEKLQRFYELGIDVDEAFEDALKSVNEMMAVLQEMHELGQTSPTSDQFRVNGTLCLKSLIQTLPTPWVRDFEFQRLAPNQKKTFKSVVEGWTQMIASNIAARLGEDNKEKAA